jgi:small GTP-binding protein
MSNISKYQAKLIIIGTVRTGKTCIFRRINTQEFYDEEVSTSVPVNINKEYSHSKGTISFEIWDTAGQEKYHSVNRFFFKNARVAILVYDITNQDSFDAITNIWLNELKNSCDYNNLILVVVGNKYDLLLNEVITEEMGENLAKEIGALFFSVSAKENIGIQTMMEKITEVYFERGLHLKPISEGEENEQINLNKSKKQKKKKCC